MSEKKPGRGRGRGTKPNVPQPAPPPSKEVVEKLLKESGENSTEDVQPQAKPATNGSVVAEVKDEPMSSEKTDSTQSSTISEVNEPVSLGTNRSLNPCAPAFTPFGSSTLSTDSTKLAPNVQGIAALKQQVQSSSLNPSCPEFVPGLRSPALNVDASVFVPKVGLPPAMQNGGTGLVPNELDDQEEIENLIPQEEELPVLEPQDIVEGFEKVEVVSSVDQAGYDHLMTATAEMLLKATMYPGSFERLKVNISTVIQKWPPADSTLKNLGEMIIHWGISEPSLRYIACRIAQELCTMLGDKERTFKKEFFNRLRAWYVAWKEGFDTEPLTAESKYYFVNLSLFYAEVFVRVKAGDTPFKGLVQPIFEFIRKLLELKEDDPVISACHMLKLTGVHLEKMDEKGTIEKIIVDLKSLALDETLPRKTTDLVVRVIQLRAQNWEKLSSNKIPPVTSAQGAAASVSSETVASKLNTDAPPFIPSTEIEFHYQQPVRNAEEWKDYFEGDDSDFTDQPDFSIEVDDEGLDPEIELEMEAFIEEIEEHLMMRDFDPDLDHSAQ